MKEGDDESLLYVQHLKHCDRILRIAVVMAMLILAVVIGMAYFSRAQEVMDWLALAFLLALGIPMLYYNIAVTLEERKLLRHLSALRQRRGQAAGKRRKRPDVFL